MGGSGRWQASPEAGWSERYIGVEYSDVIWLDSVLGVMLLMAANLTEVMSFESEQQFEQEVAYFDGGGIGQWWQVGWHKGCHRGCCLHGALLST